MHKSGQGAPKTKEIKWQAKDQNEGLKIPRKSTTTGIGYSMVLIEGMRGLGDNIYQRAFLQNYQQQVYLETPWPQIYQDLDNIIPVMAGTELRTQRKNMKSLDCWQIPKRVTHCFRVMYSDSNIFKGMTECFGFEPSAMTLPDFGESCVSGDYIVIRPVTVRAEWPNEARNPLPEYIAKAAEHIKRLGVKIVSVADLAENQEWALDPLPYADITYHKGELSMSELMALCQGSIGIVGGIGWIVPFSLASGVPSLVVCGGQGRYNHPQNLICEKQPNNITFAIPDQFCMCADKSHQCDKRIADYDDILRNWLADLE